MLLTVVCLLAVSCSNDEDGQVNAQTTMKTGKTLVVYYSYTGNSRDIVTSLTSQIEAEPSCSMPSRTTPTMLVAIQPSTL